MSYQGCSVGSRMFTCSKCGHSDYFGIRFGVPHNWGFEYSNDELKIYCPECTKILEGKNGTKM